MSLTDIQANIKVPKGQFNRFGGFHYRSAEDILTAAKPLVAADGGKLELSDEPVLVGDWHYIKATASYIDSGGHSDTTFGYAREPENKRGMDAPQITGTASSYARKYALNGLFAIDDNKDADTNEYHQQTNKPSNNYQRSNQNTIAAKTVKDPKLIKVESEYKAKLAALSKATGIDAKKLQPVAVEKAKQSTDKFDQLDQVTKYGLLISALNVMEQENQNGGNN